MLWNDSKILYVTQHIWRICKICSPRWAVTSRQPALTKPSKGSPTPPVCGHIICRPCKRLKRTVTGHRACSASLCASPHLNRYNIIVLRNRKVSWGHVCFYFTAWSLLEPEVKARPICEFHCTIHAWKKRDTPRHKVGACHLSGMVFLHNDSQVHACYCATYN